jgi:hypothetical protein
MNEGLADSDNSPTKLLSISPGHKIDTVIMAWGQYTMMNGIQCLAPTRRPTAAEIG